MGTTSTTAVTVPVTTGNVTATTGSASLAYHNTSTPPTRDDVGVEDACRLVLDNLNTHLSADVQQETILQMINLFWKGEKTQRLLTELGACKAVLDLSLIHI